MISTTAPTMVRQHAKKEPIPNMRQHFALIQESSDDTSGFMMRGSLESAAVIVWALVLPTLLG